MIIALSQTWPSNQKAQFLILANQIANFEVSKKPRIMYFKILSIFSGFGDMFLFLGNIQFSKSPHALYFELEGVYNINIIL